MTAQSAIVFGIWWHLTLMICVLVAHVSVAKCRNVQIRCNLLHLHATIDPACRPIIDLVVRRPVRSLLLLDSPLLPSREEPPDPSKCSLLVRCTSFGGADDLRGRRICRGYQPGISNRQCQERTCWWWPFLQRNLSDDQWRTGSLTYSIFDKLVAQVKAVPHGVAKINRQVYH